MDLRTGDAQPAAAGTFIRRRTAVVPAAPGTTAPLWTKFLREATGQDADLQAWLQRFAGYCLTASTQEEVFAFFYGPGGNGKGVFVSVLSALLGDLVYHAPAELFKVGSRMNREYQLVKIDGKRLVIASETESGAAMDESLVKELTGNEGKISGRHPCGRPHDFVSTAKLLIVGNHALRLRGRSNAMERRMRVVPFTHSPRERDARLKEKLIAEYPAILRWVLDGCLAWQERGLGICDAIGKTSTAYFEEQDAIEQWIDERCVRGVEHSEASSKLLEDYNGWLRVRGERQSNPSAFKEALGLKPGLQFRKTSKGNIWQGLAVRPAAVGLADMVAGGLTAC